MLHSILILILILILMICRKFRKNTQCLSWSPSQYTIWDQRAQPYLVFLRNVLFGRSTFKIGNSAIFVNITLKTFFLKKWTKCKIKNPLYLQYDQFLTKKNYYYINLMRGNPMFESESWFYDSWFYLGLVNTYLMAWIQWVETGNESYSCDHDACCKNPWTANLDPIHW